MAEYDLAKVIVPVQSRSATPIQMRMVRVTSLPHIKADTSADFFSESHC